MKSERSYSLLAFVVAGLACSNTFAQSANAVSGGNPAFSSFNYRIPSRQLDPPKVEAMTESALLDSLYGELRRVAKYPKTRERATITRLPHAQLESMVCKKPCGVLGFYRDGQIFLDDNLKPESNLYHRSILLHELVHYVQDLNGAYGTDADCDRWYLREMEAYAAQQQYLSLEGSPVHVMVNGMRAMCRDDTVRQVKLDQH